MPKKTKLTKSQNQKPNQTKPKPKKTQTKPPPKKPWNNQFTPSPHSPKTIVHKMLWASSLWYSVHIFCLMVLPFIYNFLSAMPWGLWQTWTALAGLPLPISPDLSFNKSPGLCCLCTSAQCCPGLILFLEIYWVHLVERLVLFAGGNLDFTHHLGLSVDSASISTLPGAVGLCLVNESSTWAVITSVIIIPPGCFMPWTSHSKELSFIHSVAPGAHRVAKMHTHQNAYR